MSEEIGKISWNRTENGFSIEMTGEPFRKMVESGDLPMVCMAGRADCCCSPRGSECCPPAAAEK